ncbi:hypothetical protein [Roseovarius sp. ZX-A-9]|uniref:hypothetical protein n=1 Tax=Roseovarius sp. ZX-A-9 TaxID=3014783 RepID=UPI00232D04A8|nr:hypothetical protein [Roseovarius sp. ZX-A-9]
MTNREKASEIAQLPPEKQVELLKVAARSVPPRSVRGSTKDRFYAHQCGLSRRVVKAMRDEGHGEKIFSGKGMNSGRWYFPIEILDQAISWLKSNHGRLHFHVLASRHQNRDG